MVCLQRSGLGVLLGATTWLGVNTWSGEANAQSESGVQACAHAYEDAQVQRNSGHLKAAQEQLKVCVQDQCPDFVRSDCAQWLTDVNSALPTVTFAAVDSSGGDLIDVQVSIDGQVAVGSLDGRAVEVDPGLHQIVFEYQGKKVEQNLLVRQGEKNRVVRAQIQTAIDTDGDGVLDPNDRCPTQAGDAAHAGCTASKIDIPPAQPAPGIHPLLLGTYIAGGVAAAGFITAGVFAILEGNQYKAAQKECGTPGTCTRGRIDELTASNQRKADMETVGLVVGGVGAVTGGVLFYLWMSDQDKADAPKDATALKFDVAAGPQGGFLNVAGRF
ncbi:MAG TPA: hypothetical protein VHM70_27545 [Polyangiaceae bacterium]|nr:hypothetical protein [Polyangiaceae bacterium]